jgi:hypothetical protein
LSAFLKPSSRLTLVLRPLILIVLFTGDFIGGPGDAWGSFDHFVGTGEQRRRQPESERFCVP